jgi:hypothetical protein
LAEGAVCGFVSASKISVPGAGGDRFDNRGVGLQIQVKKAAPFPFPAVGSWARASALRREMGSPRRSNLSFWMRLFRIESERLELPAPFRRRISEPLDADAAGQAAFYGGLDKVGR